MITIIKLPLTRLSNRLMDRCIFDWHGLNAYRFNIEKKLRKEKKKEERKKAAADAATGFGSSGSRSQNRRQTLADKKDKNKFAELKAKREEKKKAQGKWY